jgi:hypothetical protein
MSTVSPGHSSPDLLIKCTGDFASRSLPISSASSLSRLKQLTTQHCAQSTGKTAAVHRTSLDSFGEVAGVRSCGKVLEKSDRKCSDCM